MTERIVAVALLISPELSQLREAFDRAWPVEELDTFSDLIDAIDDADSSAAHMDLDPGPERDRE